MATLEVLHQRSNAEFSDSNADAKYQEQDAHRRNWPTNSEDLATTIGETDEADENG
ncbi:hypothetical protein ACQHIV_04270 [Kribbella sp. GL6]|uniref:hypothetical protein n=1 Tax=Kribbella sp. GL6 TaxID=3419765 RepID=UPI003CFE7D50